MQVFEHTTFNFPFLANMKIPSSTYKVSSHVAHIGTNGVGEIKVLSTSERNLQN